MLAFRNSKVTKIVIIIFAVCLDMALGTDLDCVNHICGVFGYGVGDRSRLR